VIFWIEIVAVSAGAVVAYEVVKMLGARLTPSPRHHWPPPAHHEPTHEHHEDPYRESHCSTCGHRIGKE
jgi:surfactin synthase thioesterase subunit